ncbi:porin family protein [Yunchengibacter salinarum]|uniref:porin family protein n=1 Tax=Yunchengibacter salinarum TaxID=3133399 RepID=UPI0035B63644
MTRSSADPTRSFIRPLAGVLAGALALVLSASPVLADTDFGGLYVGAEAGLSSIDIQGDGTPNLDASDLKYGGLIGYRLHLPIGIVAGVEARIDQFDAVVRDPSVGDIVAGREWAFDALGGIAFEDALIFATLGLGDARVLVRDGGFEERDSSTATRLGLGVEYGILPLVSLRGVGRFISSDVNTDGLDLSVDQWSLSAGFIVRF